MDNFEAQKLCIIKTFYMFQMNLKQILHNTTSSVQLPYIASRSL